LEVLTLITTEEMRARHQRLEDVCQQLHDLPSLPEGHKTMLFLLDELTRLLVENIRHQEAFMEEARYPQTEDHRWQHAVLL
jgi:hemerythrin